MQTTDELYAKWKELGEDNPAKPDAERALVKALTRHANAVVWLTLQRTRPDLANSAVWRVLERHESFKGDSKFSTWFHAIVRKICLSAVRDEGRSDGPTWQLDENVEVAAPETIEGVNAKLDLEKLMGQLLPEEQALLKLKLEGLTWEEIAGELGIPRSTAQSRVGGLFKKLRAEQKRAEVKRERVQELRGA